ncbi:hypothetical protein DMA11_18380 [Marinilabiliaceae bacterium JC017]|nr:hypothetical protein DMA11_18380 [Marinilabiliaceae bacterium JC017]
MKKRIFRGLGAVALLTALVVNVQMNKIEESSSLLLENVRAVAVARGEGMPSDCKGVWENVTCRSKNGMLCSYAEKI